MLKDCEPVSVRRRLQTQGKNIMLAALNKENKIFMPDVICK